MPPDNESQPATTPSSVEPLEHPAGADRRALRVAGAAFVASRVVIWIIAAATVAVIGTEIGRVIDPLAVQAPVDGVGRWLYAPAGRWDAGWFLAIARDGYGDSPQKAAFFPLYPALVAGLGAVVGSLNAAGLLVSCVSLLIALFLLHRLAALDVGEPAATRSVLLVAFFPTAFFLSAIYSEALFLALSVGAVLAARQGRWPVAGVAGGLAAATRNSGLLLLVPLLILLLYGPRADRVAPRGEGRWRPRYLPGREAAWLLLVPLGAAAALVYVAWRTGTWNATTEAQSQGWGRRFTGPLVSVHDAVRDTRANVAEIRAGASLTEPTGRGAAVRNVPLSFLALLGAAVATVGAVRRLPPAYGAYAVVGLLFAISFPVPGDPLESLPRFLLVLFPLFMWLGLWADRRRRQVALGAVWLAGLAGIEALFVSWRFVG